MKQNFVMGFKNVAGKSYAGTSNRHKPSNAAKWVNNCAGSRNVQMFFMTPDGRVLSCLPGYWGPKHFLHEAELAVKLGNVYGSTKLTAAERNDEYLNLHLRHAFEHSQSVVRDSGLQGFDRKYLLKKKKSDFQRNVGFVASGLKTPDQVLHERLAAVPFQRFEAFNTDSFVDMGTKHYSYGHGLKKGMGCKCGKKCGCGTTCGCAKKPSSSKSSGKSK